MPISSGDLPTGAQETSGMFSSTTAKAGMFSSTTAKAGMLGGEVFLLKEAFQLLKRVLPTGELAEMHQTLVDLDRTSARSINTVQNLTKAYRDHQITMVDFGKAVKYSFDEYTSLLKSVSSTDALMGRSRGELQKYVDLLAKQFPEGANKAEQAMSNVLNQMPNLVNVTDKAAKSGHLLLEIYQKGGMGALRAFQDLPCVLSTHFRFDEQPRPS